MPALPAISQTQRNPAAPRDSLRTPRFCLPHFAFFLFSLCHFVCTATAAHTPPWREDDAPFRVAAIKENSDDRFVLLDIPANHFSKPVDHLHAFRNNDTRIPAKIVFRTDDTLTALVDVRDVARDAFFHVYAFVGSDPIPVAPADAQPFDPRPLRATTYRTSGQEMPDTPAGFLLMAQRRDRRNVITADCANFDEVMERTVRRLGRSWDRPMTALEIATWLVVPEPGRYQFRLRNGGAAFLLLNGDLAAQKPDTPGDNQWFTGPPVALPAGIHRVELLTGGKRNFAALEMRWRRAERRDDDPPSTALLVTAGNYLPGRLELRDETTGLFASATMEIGESYRFARKNFIFGIRCFFLLKQIFLPFFGNSANQSTFINSCN